MTLKQYLRFYPKIELPILLSEELVLDFSRKNKPLPPEAIEEFLSIHENEADEFTEYIPCFSIPDAELYNGIVYWKGGLLHQEFVLVTYDLRGNFICRRSLASQFVDGDNIKKSVARIEENGAISIVAGHNTLEERNYDPRTSKVYKMELQNDGQVIFNTEN